MQRRKLFIGLGAAILVVLSGFLVYGWLQANRALTWTNIFTLRHRDGDIQRTAEQIRDALVSELGQSSYLPPGYPQVEALMIDPRPTLAGSQLEPRQAFRLMLDETGSSLLIFYRLPGECEARYWPYTLYLLPPWPWGSPEIGCSQRVLVEAPLELDEYIRNAFESIGARPYLP